MRNNQSKAPLKKNKNYDIVSGFSNLHELCPNFITVVNINNTFNGAFSYSNKKDLLNYLINLILMQQNMFWKRHKYTYHDTSTTLTGVLLYELFTHQIDCDSL